MRIAAVIVVAALAVALAILFGSPRPAAHKVELRVYFQDANGLRAGAPVRVAGVEVGRVKSVRARPEMKATPAEVVMNLQTPYELKIPNDSTVSLATAGILGETYAQINITEASGPPAKNGDVLKERPARFLSTAK